MRGGLAAYALGGTQRSESVVAVDMWWSHFWCGGIRCVEMALWPGVNGAPFRGYICTLSVDLCERHGVRYSGGRWAEQSAFGSGRGERASLVSLTHVFFSETSYM